MSLLSVRMIRSDKELFILRIYVCKLEKIIIKSRLIISKYRIPCYRYIMIAHHAIYSKVYKKHWIAAMIVFCWAFSYGMQLPTLFGAWGKLLF